MVTIIVILTVFLLNLVSSSDKHEILYLSVYLILLLFGIYTTKKKLNNVHEMEQMVARDNEDNDASLSLSLSLRSSFVVINNTNVMLTMATAIKHFIISQLTVNKSAIAILIGQK